MNAGWTTRGPRIVMGSKVMTCEMLTNAGKDQNLRWKLAMEYQVLTANQGAP